MHVPREKYEAILRDQRQASGMGHDSLLSVPCLQKVVEGFKKLAEVESAV